VLLNAYKMTAIKRLKIIIEKNIMKAIIYVIPMAGVPHPLNPLIKSLIIIA